MITVGWDWVDIWKDIEFTLLQDEWLHGEYIAIALHAQWEAMGNINGKCVINISELLGNCELIDNKKTTE